MRAVFSERAYTAVLAETLSKIKTETGGVFLGQCIGDVWYIVESIDPGPNSVFEVDYFEYDQPYVQHLINKKALLYSSYLEPIGLWHRHPGAFDRFSRTDGGTNAQYAAMRAQGAISMLVNLEPEFRFTIYHVAQPCTYTIVKQYEVGDELFPDGLLDYRDPNYLLARLNGRTSKYPEQEKEAKLPRKNLGEVIKIMLPELLEHCSYDPKLELFALSKKEDYSKTIAESVASDVIFLSERYGIELYPTASHSKLILAQSSGSAKTELVFTYSRKEKKVLVSYLDNTFYYSEGLFEQLIRRAVDDGV